MGKTNANERATFIERMRAEVSMSEHIARQVMRYAATVQRIAVEECSDEAAYLRIAEEQTRCPVCCGIERAAAPSVPRLCRDHRAQQRIMTLCGPFHVKAVFSGDPRGACVKLRVPSGYTDDWGRTGVCVPTPNY